MTRDEAIEILSTRDNQGMPITWQNGFVEAYDMAIEALEEVKRHEETFEWCTDCKEYDQEGHCCHRWTKCIRESVEELKRERKHGRWIKDRLCSTSGGTYGVRRCSVCEDYYQDVGYGWDYCPNCGAKMDEREEEDE